LNEVQITTVLQEVCERSRSEMARDGNYKELQFNQLALAL